MMKLGWVNRVCCVYGYNHVQMIVRVGVIGHAVYTVIVVYR